MAFPTLLALVAGGLFPAINNLRVWARSRRLEPLGIIVMTFLAIGTAISLTSGSVFIALIKDSFLTATFGFICLGSLLAERPLMFYINRQFVAGDDPVRLEWWNGRWQHPHFRAAQRFVTAVWGLVYLVESLSQGRFRPGPFTGAGRGDLARDGIRRADRAHRVDAAIYARAARTADTR